MSEDVHRPLHRSDRGELRLEDGGVVQLRRMERGDLPDVVAFFRSLGADASTLPVDIDDSVEVERWIAEIETARTTAILASTDAGVIAYIGFIDRSGPVVDPVGEVRFQRTSSHPDLSGRRRPASRVRPGISKLERLLTSATHNSAIARIRATLGFSANVRVSRHTMGEGGSSQDICIIAPPAKHSTQIIVPPKSPATDPQHPHAQGQPVAMAEERLAALRVSDNSTRPRLAPTTPNVSAAARHGNVPTTMGGGWLKHRTRIVGLAALLFAVAAGIALTMVARDSTSRTDSQVLGAVANPIADAAPDAKFAFSETREGSGAVLLPAAGRSMNVRVKMDSGVTGTWFWCVESSFGLPPSAHQCRSSSNVPRTSAGDLIADVRFDIDPSWPVDALYIVNMFCAKSCSWRAGAAPIDPTPTIVTAIDNTTTTSTESDDTATDTRGDRTPIGTSGDDTATEADANNHDVTAVATPNNDPTTTGANPPITTTSNSARFVGVNNWSLGSRAGSAFAQICGAGDQYLASKMTLFQQDNVQVVRVAAYQSLATNAESGRDWTGLDNMFAAVNAAHIKVIPILGDNWTDCDYLGARPSYCGSTSSGKGCTSTCGSSWYDTDYTTPTDGYPISYQAWATEVVSRYAGNPAIAAWEILNEPWGPCVHNFFVDMSTRIRAADPTTPISLGGSEAGGWDYRAENSLPNVNWATFHYYGHALEAIPASEQADLSIAKSLGKPFYVGENGIGASDLGTACDTQERADLFSQKIAASFAAGAMGYLPWAFSYTQAAGVCSYNFGPNSPVMQMFRQF